MIIDSRYKTIETLYSGEWSIVHKVKDIRSKKIYALKIFKQVNATDFYKRFSPDDMYHMCKIEHPNIIKVYDFGSFENQIYLISEYFEARSLKEFRLLDINTFYKLIIQICLGLDVLHSQGIIHKNLRNENIVFKSDKNSFIVKIIECSFSSLSSLRSHSNIDFIPYIAPELYRRGKASEASDLYSLGVILYHIATQNFPFSIEQIKNIENFENSFPTPPNLLNTFVDENLNEIILTLLQKNPTERFKSVSHLLEHIRTIPNVDYDFSTDITIINKVKMSNYALRKNLSSQLKDNLDVIKNNAHGKIFSIIGSKGYGKRNLLLNFRYSILTDEYLIFTYDCKDGVVDPFYTIVKESFFSNKENKHLIQTLDKISKKYRTFLYKSEEKAKKIPITQSETNLDIKAIKHYLFELSKQKPLVIIIENFNSTMEDSFSLLNQLSKRINKYPIMIIITSITGNTLSKLYSNNEVIIPKLSLEQTKNYIFSILNSEIPFDVIELIYKKAGGNPKILNDILLNLIKNGIIKEKIYSFDSIKKYLKKIVLPQSVLSFIKKQVSQWGFTPKNYEYLKILSSIEFVMETELIKQILNIKNKELCFLLEEAQNNEIITKDGIYFHFAFEDARLLIKKKSNKKTIDSTNKKILKFYENKQVSDIDIVSGLINVSKKLGDKNSFKKYTLILTNLYSDRFLHEKAFKHLYIILLQDIKNFKNIDKKEFWKNSFKLFEKAKIVNKIKPTLSLYLSYNLPDCFEKLYLLGSNSTSIKSGINYFKTLLKAYSLAETKDQKIIVLFSLCKNSFKKGNRIKSYFKEVEKFEMTTLQKIEFTIIKAKYLLFTKDFSNATTIVEKCYNSIPSGLTKKEDFKTQKLLANLYKTLGNCFFIERLNSKAHKLYSLAHDIYNKIFLPQGKAEVHNDFARIALSSGDVDLAFKNLFKALKISKEIENRPQIENSYHILGKISLKTGNYKKAVPYFRKAARLAKALKNNQSYNSIRKKIAISKLRVDGLGKYYKYLKVVDPNLVNWKFKQMNNLVRSFFIFYTFTDRTDILKNKLKKLFSQYVTGGKYLEFYHNILSLIAFIEKDYKTSIEHLSKSLTLVGEKNLYTQTIIYYKLIKSAIALKDYVLAESYIKTISPIAKKHEFLYWKIAINLLEIILKLNTGIKSYREVLRNIHYNLKFCEEQNFFLHKIFIFKLIIKIHQSVGFKEQIDYYKNKLSNEVLFAVKNLPSGLKKDITNKLFQDISEHYEINLNNDNNQLKVKAFQQEISTLLDIENIDRIKFFIKKFINTYFSPSRFFITINSDIYISSNINENDINNFFKKGNKKKETILNYDEKSQMIIPLHIKSTETSFLVVEDNSKVPYFDKDLIGAKKIVPLLSLIIKQSILVDSIQSKENMLTLLFRNNILYNADIGNLKREIVKLLLEITGASRGFFVQIDYSEHSFGKSIWVCGVDNHGNNLSSYRNVSNTVVTESEKGKKQVYMLNTEVSDEVFVNISAKLLGNVFDIYCQPIIIESMIYGFVYLDNYNSPNKRMKINFDFLDNLSEFLGNSLRNANYSKQLYIKLDALSKREILKTSYLSIINDNFLKPLNEIQKYISEGVVKKEKANPLIEKIFILNHSTENQILYNSLNEKKLKVRIKYNIVPQLQKVIKEFKDYLRIKDATVKIHIKSELQSITLNKIFLRVLIKNTILNAIQNSVDGKIDILVRTSAFEREQINNKESMVVTVTNNGKTISPNRLSSIFSEYHSMDQKFNSLKKSTYSNIENKRLGLGLFLCKKITNGYNGDIWINPLPQSVNVSFSLPL